MIGAITLISSLACGIALDDAKRLVLETPQIRAAVVERHARPFFESVQANPDGWSFEVKARNPCSGPGPCSNLLGHYTVSRHTGGVIATDEGDDGKPVSTAQLEVLRRKLLRDRCGKP